MSGKRQHFIPRFLQTGFSQQEETPSAWVHRKDNVPFRTNTINSGVESYFYSLDSDHSVDNAITELEEKFAPLVKTLRNYSDETLSDPSIPKLLAHLETRTRLIRVEFIKSAEILSELLIQFIEDEDRFVEFLKMESQKNPEVILNQILEKMPRFPGLDKDQLTDYVRQNLPEFFEQMKPQLKYLGSSFRNIIQSKLKDSGKSGHLIALGKTLTPVLRVSSFSHLTYRVIDYPAGDLILGDSMVIFKTDNPNRPFRPFIDKGDLVEIAYLPISPSRILIGSSSKSHSIFTENNLNEEIAKCSSEFFISSNNLEIYEPLSKNIGVNSHLLNESEIGTILRDILESPFPKTKLP